MKTERNSQSGQSLVEFALILPVFILFIMGIIDMGRLVYTYSALHNAVREGARYGVIDSSRTALQIQNVVEDTAVGLDTSKLAVTSNTVAGTGHSTLSVNAQYQFAAATPVINAFAGGSGIVLNSRVTMNAEGW